MKVDSNSFIKFNLSIIHSFLTPPPTHLSSTADCGYVAYMIAMLCKDNNNSKHEWLYDYSLRAKQLHLPTCSYSFIYLIYFFKYTHIT